MLDEAIAIAGTQSALARLIGARPQEVWNWANGRPIPPDRCSMVERVTGGRVSCESLRPDIAWQRVPDPEWPHPQGRPCIDVAAPRREAA